MWDWRFQDIPEVVENCRELSFAVFGGAVIFIFPDGVGELYWLQVYPEYRAVSETWAKYIKRSCSEFLDLFNALMAKANFEKEILEWGFLKKNQDAAEAVMKHLCFELRVYSETKYLQLGRKYRK